MQDLIDQIEKQLQDKWDEYVELNKELDTHRGHELSDTNLMEVNRLLSEIQDVFAEIYPVLNFVQYRHQFSTNAINGYNQFVTSLKRAGAEEVVEH